MEKSLACVVLLALFMLSLPMPTQASSHPYPVAFLPPSDFTNGTTARYIGGGEAAVVCQQPDGTPGVGGACAGIDLEYGEKINVSVRDDSGAPVGGLWRIKVFLGWADLDEPAEGEFCGDASIEHLVGGLGWVYVHLPSVTTTCSGTPTMGEISIMTT